MNRPNGPVVANVSSEPARRGRRCTSVLQADRDRGSASVLALGTVGALIGITAAVLVVTGAYVEHRRAAVAGDAAALGAADVASGRAGGSPCAEAQRIAEANGAHLESCSLDGPVVSVTASTGYLGFRARVDARAGPPGTG